MRPVGETAAALLGSLQQTRGFERALDYAFYQVAAINGFDSFGHYLRAGLIVNQCSTYAVNPTPGCTANFVARDGHGRRVLGPDGPRDPVLAATAEAIRRAMAGETERGAEAAGHADAAARARRARAAPPSATPTATPSPSASATPAPQAPRGARAERDAGARRGTGDEPLLDYLFGKDAP